MPRATIEKAAQSPISINVAAPPAPAEPQPEEKHEEKAPRWFFDKIAEIATNDWGRIWSMELHRREPVVPGQPGSKGYLCLFVEPVTLGGIQERYGGGKFRLNLCKNGRWTTSHDFDIEGAPKYDLSRENPNGASKANGNGGGSDSKLLDMLQKQFDRMDERITALQTQGVTGDAGKELVIEGAKAAIGMVKEQSTQAKSSSSEIREMVAALKDMGIIGGVAAHSKTLVEQIIELVQTPVIGPQILSLFAPKNPLDELVKLKGVKELLDGLGGGGGGDGKADWKTALVDRGIPAVQELVGALADNRKAAVDLAKEQRGRAEANARAAERIADLNAQRSNAVAPHAANAPQPAAAPPAQAGAPPAPVGAGPFRVVPINGDAAAAAPGAPMPTPETTANADEFLKGVKIRFVELLAAGEDTELIVDFLDMARPDLVEMMLKYSPAQITGFFKMDPIVKHAVDNPRWGQFLQEARAYLEEPEAELKTPNSLKN